MLTAQNNMQENKTFKEIKPKLNTVISGIMLVPAILSQKMVGLASLHTKLPLDVHLMVNATENVVCTHTRIKIRLFYPISRTIPDPQLSQGATGDPLPTPGWAKDGHPQSG